MNYLQGIIKIDKSSKEISCKKGEILQYAGTITSLAYYVKKGLLRSYSIDGKGKEHVFIFASEGWIMADIESQEFNTPTELFIECLENSELIVFDRKCLVEAKLSDEQRKDEIRLMSRRIAVLQRRVLLLMSSSAKERYNSFLATYPDLPNRVPQHMIASYLGITPQALSTIRREMVGKN